MSLTCMDQRGINGATTGARPLPYTRPARVSLTRRSRVRALVPSHWSRAASRPPRPRRSPTAGVWTLTELASARSVAREAQHRGGRRRLDGVQRRRDAGRSVRRKCCSGTRSTTSRTRGDSPIASPRQASISRRSCISHPDHDHSPARPTIVERFPGNASVHDPEGAGGVQANRATSVPQREVAQRRRCCRTAS